MAVNNTLGDLNNFLFGQLERLDNPDLTDKEMKLEIERTKAMTDVAKSIISNGQLALNAQKHYDNPERIDISSKKPKMLEIESDSSK